MKILFYFLGFIFFILYYYLNYLMWKKYWENIVKKFFSKLIDYIEISETEKRVFLEIVDRFELNNKLFIFIKSKKK